MKVLVSLPVQGVEEADWAVPAQSRVEEVEEQKSIVPELTLLAAAENVQEEKRGSAAQGLIEENGAHICCRFNGRQKELTMNSHWPEGKQELDRKHVAVLLQTELVNQSNLDAKTLLAYSVVFT